MNQVIFGRMNQTGGGTTVTWRSQRLVCERAIPRLEVDLSTDLRERKVGDLEQVARSTELFHIASQRQLSDRARQDTITGQSEPPIVKKEKELIFRIPEL